MTKNELAKALFGDKYNYVEHYGIKGQQWGKRRFQNEDGSLTAAGKLRYLNGSQSIDGTDAKITGAQTIQGTKLESIMPRSRQRNITGEGKGIYKREMAPSDWGRKLAQDYVELYTKRNPKSTSGSGINDASDMAVALYESGTNASTLSDKQLEKMIPKARKIAEKALQRARKVKSRDLASSPYTSSGMYKVNKMIGLR